MNNLIKAENFGVEFLDFNFSFPCEIHHCFPRATPDQSKYRVLIHSVEPSPLKWDASEVLKYHSNFDLILTSERSLIHLPNVKFFIFGDTWVRNYAPNKKDFSVSYLHSKGIGAEWNGYKLRSELWNSRKLLNEIKFIKLWYSNRRPPDDISELDKKFDFSTKEILYESMFSICIENHSENDYFSEKIIDAFNTYTVPIYYGCKNINTYFDEKGIIKIESLEDLIETVKNLSPNDYYERIEYIHKNKIFAEKFSNGILNIKEIIEKNYNKLNQVEIELKNKSLSTGAHPESYSSSCGVEIMDGTRIDCQTRIGNYTYIGINVSVTFSSIGNYCSIANNVNIGQGEHDLNEISTSSIFYENAWEKLTAGTVNIGNDVWVGAGATILRGVNIGTGAVIGANAVVTSDVPPFAIVVGIPARIIRFRFSQDKINIILKSEWWKYHPNEANRIFEIINLNSH